VSSGDNRGAMIMTRKAILGLDYDYLRFCGLTVDLGVLGQIVCKTRRA
jgi:hypothetical protein